MWEAWQHNSPLELLSSSDYVLCGEGGEHCFRDFRFTSHRTPDHRNVWGCCIQTLSISLSLYHFPSKIQGRERVVGLRDEVLHLELPDTIWSPSLHIASSLWVACCSSSLGLFRHLPQRAQRPLLVWGGHDLSYSVHWSVLSSHLWKTRKWILLLYLIEFILIIIVG
jgi:hypothetical protein